MAQAHKQANTPEGAYPGNITRPLCLLTEANYNTQPKLADEASFSNKFGVFAASVAVHGAVNTKIES